MSSFDPSPLRQGLNLLLKLHPHLDLVAAWRPGAQRAPGDPEAVASPWLRVELGQPSEDGSEAYAIWEFAIWRSTGACYRMSEGMVEDDPFAEPGGIEVTSC